ncbi:MAG: chromate transporter, partial [Sedimentibacter sp.]|nr:chromate transporter [Sedimentibacter sp.]
IIAGFYTAFKENRIINALLLGMRAGVAAVIIDVIIKMARNVIRTKNNISIAIMVTALIAAVIFDINAALIIILSGVFGGFYYNIVKRTGDSQ